MWTVSKDYLQAGSDALAPAEMFRLAGSKDKRVRCRIAENSSCTIELQLLLLQDANWEVRASLALNARVSEELLEILAEDPNTNVRFSLADNSLMPACILEFLSHDDNPYVSETARRNFDRKTQIAVRQKISVHWRAGEPGFHMQKLKVSMC